MAAISFPRELARRPSGRYWRVVAVGLLVGAVLFGMGGSVAANNSVQGAKKDEGGFDGDAPTAILIEAKSSGSVLFEKNADELRAPVQHDEADDGRRWCSTPSRKATSS